MRVHQPAPHVSLVVKWPAAAANETAARHLMQWLNDARLPATWSVEHKAQAEALAAWGIDKFGGDAALLLAGEEFSLGGDRIRQHNRQVIRQLEQIRSAGVGAKVLHVTAEIAKAGSQRWLSAPGVRAIVADLVGEAPRPLPRGAWQFSPQVSLPSQRRWFHWFRRGASLVEGGDGTPVMASIDLAAPQATASHARRETEQLIAQLANARAKGAIAVASVAEVAAWLADTNAPKPQRSILRSAA